MTCSHREPIGNGFCPACEEGDDFLDVAGYPTESALQAVRDWNPTDGRGLLAFLRSIWWHPAAITEGEDGTWSVSTVGWSGNEDLINALMDNHIWWTLHWESSRRGGHYVFKVRELKGYNDANEET